MNEFDSFDDFSYDHLERDHDEPYFPEQDQPEDMNEYPEEDYNEERDQFRDDVEADADALASAGFGTDEDYGYFGGDD